MKGARNIETLKSFITRRSDRFRLPYDRRTDIFPRQFVIAGSTNDEAYLTDPTGNRRYWPVDVKHIDLAALLRDREQLWAEAVTAYRAGEPWHLPPELERLAAEEQDERRAEHPWLEIIRKYISELPDAAKEGAVHGRGDGRCDVASGEARQRVGQGGKAGDGFHGSRFGSMPPCLRVATEASVARAGAGPE